MLSKDEILYADLSHKSRFIELDKDEKETMEDLRKSLGLVICDTCKGEGSFTNPSILGYGYEEGDCVKCNGAGYLNLSGELLEELYGGC